MISGVVSLPHGSADRNIYSAAAAALRSGRSLTGARIETSVAETSARGRGESLPHGSADRNIGLSS